MPDKEDEFDGEYDFYDGGFNEDERKDREKDEEDLDVKKEKEKREFLSKRSQELSDQMNAFVANGGYKQNYPNIHFSDMIDEGYITFIFRDEEQFDSISEKELEAWIKGKFKFDKKDSPVIESWYSEGTYRYFKILDKLKKRYYKEKNMVEAKKLEDLIDLNEEKFKSAKRVELAKAYNESGERVKKLYLALYGRSDRRFFDMGCFRVSVPEMFYTQEMKKFEYSTPTKFFNDFKNAYDFIFSLKGDYAIGTLTDKCWEDIGGYAYGEGDIIRNDREFEINSIIEREEWFEKRECYSKVRDINISNEEFLFWLHKYTPDIDAVETNYESIVFWKGNEVEGEYFPDSKDGFHLAIKAPVELQEKFIKSLIEYASDDNSYDGLLDDKEE